MHFFHQASFLTSAAELSQLPPDTGIEVAFAGRSNAGKSSALNVLTGQKQLAKVSKTPGRTQLINLFTLEADKRIVDLPGYGYAQVAQAIKDRWQRTLARYLESRECLKGLVLLMDARHPLRDQDCQMIGWAREANLRLHLLLTKADKLSRNEQHKTENWVRRELEAATDTERLSIQLFSALKKTGLSELQQILARWYQMRV